MATAEQLPILLKNNDHAGPGFLHVWAYDSGDRLKRAAKTWIWLWIGAVIAFYPPLLIPGPHLAVTIPLSIGLFIAGPVAAYRRYHALQTSEKATGTCPVCHNDVSIHLEPKERPELWKYCPSCNSPLQLVEPSNKADVGGEN